MEAPKTGKSPDYSCLTKNDSDLVRAELYTQLPRLKPSRRTETVFRACEGIAFLFITCALLYCSASLWRLRYEVDNLKEQFQAEMAAEGRRSKEFNIRTDDNILETTFFPRLIIPEEDESSEGEIVSPFKRKREIAGWQGPTSERTLESKEIYTSSKSFSSEEYSSSEPSTNFESSSPRGRRRRKNLRKPKKYHRHSVPAEKFYSDIQSTTSSPVQIRQSRTKQTAGLDIGKHKRVFEHKPLLQVYGSKEFITIEEALRRPGVRNLIPEHVETGKRHKSGNVSHVDHPTPKEFAESIAYNMIMVHYAADTSHYSRERDSNYCGNGRMQMKESIYKDWKAAHSTQGVDITKYFSLHRGEVTVSVTGIYLIYAQVQYSNLQEVNGYEVIRNKQTVVQCITTSVHPDKHEIKSNTCDTSTTILLYAGDKIYLQDLHHGRHVVLKPEKSYFGLILLSPFKENNRLL